MRFILDSLLVIVALKVFSLGGNVAVVAAASVGWTLYAGYRLRTYRRGRLALKQFQQSQAGLQVAAKNLGEAFTSIGAALGQAGESAKQITEAARSQFATMAASETVTPTKPEIIN